MATELHHIGIKLATPDRQKLQDLAEATGATKTDVLRTLIRNAELRQVQRLEPRLAALPRHPQTAA